MCMFTEYARQDWGDDVHIGRGIYLPPNYWCSKCSLNNGKDFRVNIKDENWSEGLRGTINIENILEHIRNHTKAGHRIHPAVTDCLCYEYQSYRRQITKEEWEKYGKFYDAWRTI